MQWMIAGFTALLGAQQLNAAPGVKARLVARFGAAAVAAGLGALALAGFALIVIGRGQAAYEFVWLPPVELRILILPLMFLACIFAAASLVPSNLRRLSRRPVLWGVVLWSIAHLLAKENLAAIVFFAGFGLLALVELGSLSRRGLVRNARREPWLGESRTVGLGGVMFIVMFYSHAQLFGVSPAMLSRPFG